MMTPGRHFRSLLIIGGAIILNVGTETGIPLLISSHPLIDVYLVGFGLAYVSPLSHARGLGLMYR